MTPYKIPFNKPKLVGPELQYIQDAIRHGHLSGDGPYTKKMRSFAGKATWRLARSKLDYILHPRFGNDGPAA